MAAMPNRSREEISTAVSTWGRPREIAWRAWRWAATFDQGLIAFAADDDDGWDRLRREGALLACLRDRVAFGIPGVIVEDEARRLQLRRMVPGITGQAVEQLVFGHATIESAGARYRPGLPLTREGARLARDLGRALGELQHAVSVDDAHALGFGRREYGPIVTEIDAYLTRRHDLRDLHEVLLSLRSWFAMLPEHLAFCLCDLQLHNMSVRPQDGGLGGLFDFDDAAVADGLEDFKYLPSFGIAFTQTALEAFVAAGGRAASIADIGRFHVLSALEHFLFVPEESERWPRIVEWVRSAVAHFARDW
ncbi:phosphotransferase [Pendulispora rubella]|uniref:Phosphotransferase n=1 Tax=Pendulispora rubella TaxID=2741070 RepID=A0ABZ2KU54_9BACT